MVCAVIFLPYLIEIVFYFDGFNMIDKYLYAAVPPQILGIICTFIWKRQVMCDLINANGMWPIHKFGPVLENKMLAKRREAFVSVLTIFIVMLFVCVIIFASYVIGGNLIFLGYRQCQLPVCLKIQFFLQLICMLITIICVVAYVGFFWILISQSLCHLEILRYGIKYTRPDDLEDNLMDIVGQYINILRFIGLIDNMYSSSLLVLFVLYPTYMILGLFSITLKGMPIPTLTMLQILPIVTICLLTLFTFCAAGEIIHIEFELLSRTVYEIDWLHPGVNRLAKDIILMLQMTQNSPNITIKSLRPLNLNVYLQVLKFCYSVYTCLLAIGK